MKLEETSYRALQQFGWIENFGQDVRYGARMLCKNPGFTEGVPKLVLAKCGFIGELAHFHFVRSAKIVARRKDPK
jgi:hypothetical protein